MRLLIDECCSRPLIDALRRAGHDVLAVADVARGAADDKVTALARAERRILFTEDRGFGDKAVRLGALPEGLVLLACQSMSLYDAAERTAAVVAERGERLRGRLTVVQREKVRARAISGSVKERD